MKRPAFLLGLTAFSFLLSPSSYAGMCAMCRRTLEMTGGQGLIKGFGLSILLIGGMPLLIAGFAVFVFMRGAKKSRENLKGVHHVES